MLTHEPHLQIIKSSLLFRILLIWLCLAKKAPPICFSNRRFMWSNQTEESWLKGRAGPKAARFREWIQWGRCTEVQRKINESGLTGWLPSMLYFVFLHFKIATSTSSKCSGDMRFHACYWWMLFLKLCPTPHLNYNLDAASVLCFAAVSQQKVDGKMRQAAWIN